LQVLFERHVVTHYTEGLTDALRGIGCDVELFGHYATLHALINSLRVGPATIGVSLIDSARFFGIPKPYDVVHLNTALHGDLIRIFRLIRKPFIITHHGVVSFEPQATRSETLAARFTDGNLKAAGKLGIPIVAVSQFAAESIRQGLGIDPTVIYHGVRTDRFSPSMRTDYLRSLLGIPNDRVVALWVGRGHPSKDPFTLLRAAARFRAANPEIVFVMKLWYPSQLDAAINAHISRNNLGDLVRVIETVPWDRMPELYASADFLVHTSREEAFGLAVLEGMASGLPVVVSDEGAPAEFVGEGGLIFRSGDDSDLAEKATRLKDDTARRTALGKTARAIAETRFTWRSSAERYVDLYLKACE
jgi:glycosyltransferase involved in cell wall biosynthesis